MEMQRESGSSTPRLAINLPNTHLPEYLDKHMSRTYAESYVGAIIWLQQHPPSRPRPILPQPRLFSPISTNRVLPEYGRSTTPPSHFAQWFRTGTCSESSVPSLVRSHFGADGSKLSSHRIDSKRFRRKRHPGCNYSAERASSVWPPSAASFSSTLDANAMPMLSVTLGGRLRRSDLRSSSHRRLHPWASGCQDHPVFAGRIDHLVRSLHDEGCTYLGSK